MERRSFLRFLGLGAATAAGVAAGVVDPERLLWTPGKKSIFVFDGPVTWHGENSLSICSMITQEALRLLENQMVLAQQINLQFSHGNQWPRSIDFSRDAEYQRRLNYALSRINEEVALAPRAPFAIEGRPIGTTVNIRKPQRYIGREV